MRGLYLWVLGIANAPVLPELMRIDEYYPLKESFDSRFKR